MLFLSLALALGGITMPTSILSHALTSHVLPKPIGPLPVARSVTELIDYSRTQPFAPDVEPRRLMISVFYPVPDSSSHQLVPYMPSLTARFEDIELSSWGLNTPNGTMESLFLRLSTPPNKPSKPNNPPKSYPLALFLPAEGTTRLFYSQLASTIASAGYTIVTLDLPYDVDIVQYTDNSTAILNTTLVAAENATQQLAGGSILALTGAQDASFVLTALSNKTLAHSLVPTYPLNTTHTVMFGHSIGGASSLTALSIPMPPLYPDTPDPRILGGLNMDGAFFPPPPGNGTLGTSKPYMIMAHANHTRVKADPLNSWATTWPVITGWKRDILIAETLHYDFSDYGIVFETLGITPGPKVASSELILLGSMKGTRALQIVSTYITAFLDFVLAGKDSPLLNGPVKAFPEVTFDE